MKNFKTDEPCIGCRKETEGGNCLHHVYTKKAYPQFKYELWNLMPLCFRCHELVHRSLNIFVKKRRGVEKWLTENGWYFSESRDKWVRDL